MVGPDRQAVADAFEKQAERWQVSGLDRWCRGYDGRRLGRHIAGVFLGPSDLPE